MALSRHGKALVYGTGTSGARKQTVQKRFASENEVINGEGEIDAIILSGAETVTSTTTAGADSIGVSGLTIRSRVEYSNEDVPMTTNEVLSFDDFGGSGN